MLMKFMGYTYGIINKVEQLEYNLALLWLRQICLPLKLKALGDMEQHHKAQSIV